METNCMLCETMRPEPEVCGHPERDPDPRDERERGTRGETRPACACGRAVVVRGMCAYCLHGLPPMGDIDAALAICLGRELLEVAS
jgi:hypothetical protein